MFYQAIYLFIAALVLAYLEVQIEGKHGWASRLPTWRGGERWYGRLYRRLMSGKELTGYHLGVFGFVLLFLHYPFFSGQSWSAATELWTLSLFFLFSIVWDYLWIIINPHYGVIKRHPKNDVWWHAHWWGPFPRDYYFGVILSLAVLSPLWQRNGAVLHEWGKVFGVFIVGTVIILLITEMTRGDVEHKD